MEEEEGACKVMQPKRPKACQQVLPVTRLLQFQITQKTTEVTVFSVFKQVIFPMLSVSHNLVCLSVPLFLSVSFYVSLSLF